MRRANAIVVMMFVVAPALHAGEPPKLEDIFKTAKRCFELTKEQHGVIDEIKQKRDKELGERMKEIAKELDNKYVEIVGEALPAAEREKYQKLIVAQQERDEITASADAKYTECPMGMYMGANACMPPVLTLM